MASAIFEDARRQLGNMMSFSYPVDTFVKVQRPKYPNEEQERDRDIKADSAAGVRTRSCRMLMHYGCAENDCSKN